MLPEQDIIRSHLNDSGQEQRHPLEGYIFFLQPLHLSQIFFIGDQRLKELCPHLFSLHLCGFQFFGKALVV